MKVKMMFLLVSAVALLVDPAVSSPTARSSPSAPVNLNEIIHVVGKYNTSVTKEFFVEDVTHLFNAGCKDEFFCKVHDILVKHDHFGRRRNQEEEKIVRILERFTRGKLNCKVLLNNETTVVITKPIPDLLENLIKCIRKRNFNGST